MVSTIPSAIAWRAKSRLVQWVMCNPLAIGSKQACSTIWTRCRGGKPLRSARALNFAEHRGEARLLIATTDTPNGGPVALQLAGYRLHPLPAPNRQENACMLDLEPRLRATMREIL